MLNDLTWEERVRFAATNILAMVRDGKFVPVAQPFVGEVAVRELVAGGKLAICGDRLVLA